MRTRASVSSKLGGCTFSSSFRSFFGSACENNKKPRIRCEQSVNYRAFLEKRRLHQNRKQLQIHWQRKIIFITISLLIFSVLPHFGLDRPTVCHCNLNPRFCLDFRYTLGAQHKDISYHVHQ